MKMFRLSLAGLSLLFAVLFSFGQNAQLNSPQSPETYIVTSVTMRIDSVTTVEQMNKITALIKSHEEIRDFDIKGEKCNFTMEPSNNLLNLIEQELTAEGYSSEYLVIRDNQSMTTVPFTGSGKKPEDGAFQDDPRRTKDSIRIQYESGN